MNEEKSGYGYGKRPMWQWVLLYVVIGGIIYGLVYYFVLADNGYSSTPLESSDSPTQQIPTY